MVSNFGKYRITKKWEMILVKIYGLGEVVSLVLATKQNRKKKIELLRDEGEEGLGL